MINEGSSDGPSNGNADNTTPHDAEDDADKLADDATSMSLLNDAVAQDALAWQRLWMQYTPLIRRWCRSRGLQSADADVVAQEVVLAVHRKLPEFRHAGRVGAFRAWLRTITESKLNDHFRQQGRGPLVIGGSKAQQLIEQAPTPEEQAAVSDEKRQLARDAMALAQQEFSHLHWQAFLLTTIDQRDARDAAEQLRMTRNAVYMARSRILKYLRREFQDFFDAESAPPPAGEAG